MNRVIVIALSVSLVFTSGARTKISGIGGVAQVTSLPACATPARAVTNIPETASASVVSHVVKEDLSNLIAATRSVRIPKETLNAILAISESSRVDPVVVSGIYALLYCHVLDAEQIVEMVVTAAMAGVKPEGLKRLIALAKLNGGVKSRFDILNPSFFSRMWAVKMKALNAEKEGKDTDELWKTYWKLFESDVYADDAKED